MIYYQPLFLFRAAADVVRGGRKVCILSSKSKEESSKSGSRAVGNLKLTELSKSMEGLVKDPLLVRCVFGSNAFVFCFLEYSFERVACIKYFNLPLKFSNSR